MMAARSALAVTSLLALAACGTSPPRPAQQTAITHASTAPALRGIALLPDAAVPLREATLEVVLVALDSGDAVVHATFAAVPASRLEFSLPADALREARLRRCGWRVYLRDASGRLRYASERLVAAEPDAVTSIAMRVVSPR